MTDEMSSVEAAYFNTLLQLFSIVMVLDRGLKVVFASDTLHRHVPGLSESPPLTEAFKLERPRNISSYEDIVERLNSLFLLTSIEGSFAIRGQFIHGTENRRDYLVFCGAPWLHWMNTNKPEVKLGLRDFSHQDVQLDQLLYMATESNMVADLERLNTELTRAKEQVEKAQTARNAFFAQMSHELRTPLNGVVSALALMQEESIEGRAGELLTLAQKSSGNMLEVINYVLDIAKMESQEIAISHVDFNLPELVESVVDIVRPRALAKNLDLRVRANTNLSQVYRGDASTLHRVLLNLLVNAVKFTEQGGVTVDIDSGRSPGMSLCIEVLDTGIGIALDAQATVFEPYSTAGNSHGAVLGEGSGLGLDIAKRSVEAMGGIIGVVSAAGAGSRFWLELPLEAVAAADSAITPDTQAQPRASFAGRVLLVDDNETNLTLMSLILESHGVSVTPVTSGEEAVALVESEAFDLVLMDISMPGIDGFEATRLIRQLRDRDAFPVVALTAYTGNAERDQIEASSLDGYLAKPLEQSSLVEMLARYLQAGSAENDEAPAVSENEGAVDLDVVHQLQRQIGTAGLVTVIDKFGGEAESRWLALSSAANAKDLAREAHTLASTCRSFGLPAVADELGAIEEKAKSGATLEQQLGLEVTGARLRDHVAQLRNVVAALAKLVS